MTRSYKDQANIQPTQNETKKPLISQLEYTSEAEYQVAQKKLHDMVHSMPAVTCVLCGYPMDYQGHILTEWEKKWSTHEVCKEKMHRLLDRETGIARERRASSGRNRN